MFLKIIRNLMNFPKIYDLRKTNVGIDVFVALVWIDAELFSRVGRQSERFCFVNSVCFFYALVLSFFYCLFRRVGWSCDFHAIAIFFSYF